MYQLNGNVPISQRNIAYVVGQYMILCMYGSCAASCNQEPDGAVVGLMVFRDIAGMSIL